MIFPHHDLDETDVALLRKIGKRAQNVVAVAEHTHLFGHQRQQRALHEHGYDDDDEYDAEQVIRQRRFAQSADRIDGEHDRRHPAQPRPRHDADLVPFGAERREQRRNRSGAGVDGHEQEYEQRGQENIRLNEPFGGGEQAE